MNCDDFCKLEDADIEQYKKLAKKTCEIEHNNFVAQDEIKEAAKANSVEEFEDVIIEITMTFSFQTKTIIYIVIVFVLISFGCRIWLHVQQVQKHSIRKIRSVIWTLLNEQK